MLKILRWNRDESVVFILSGRIEGETLAELSRVIGLEARDHNLVLDMKDITLVDQSAIQFLARCEAENVTLENCPAYIREWIRAEKQRDSRRMP